LNNEKRRFFIASCFCIRDECDNQKKLNFCFFVIFCFFVFFLYFVCSQHGYIFLAGAGAKPPDEVKSGRHTEYRLIKSTVKDTLPKRLEEGKRQSINNRKRDREPCSPDFGFLGQGFFQESRVPVNVYDIYNKKDELHVTR